VSTAKQEARLLLDQIPDDATFEDIQYQDIQYQTSSIRLTLRSKSSKLNWKPRWDVLLFITATVKNKTPLIVPPAVRRQAGLRSGDRLEFKVSGQVITILPKPSAVEDEYTPAERRAIDRGIALSETQYAAGKSYGPFKTAAEAIASLDANLRRRRAAKKKLAPASR
jgi:bifunctional DNA-binding transcriptional regulator/antitoxin component of YhaV-PrlF toxin-antitoxin module